MPERPLKPCAKQGCSRLTRERYCEQHIKRKVQENRPNANARGYTRRWSKAAREYLSTNPWCKGCEAAEEWVLAELVDHVIPHKGDEKLFWDEHNWQGLCWSCHSRKTAREDGGFGRPPSHGK